MSAMPIIDAVQEQLAENKRRARIPEKGSRYLLQGLLVCAQCGYAYCGLTNDERNAYYRCGPRTIGREQAACPHSREGIPVLAARLIGLCSVWLCLLWLN